MKIYFNKNVILILATLFIQLAGFAQEKMTTSAPVEMADGLYQSGKIYVVVTALAVIFIGIIVYLILLDKKISKLEKELNN